MSDNTPPPWLEDLTAWQNAEYDGLRGQLPKKTDRYTLKRFTTLSNRLFMFEHEHKLNHETVLSRFRNYTMNIKRKLSLALSGRYGQEDIPVLDDLLRDLAEIYQCLKPQKRGRKKLPIAAVDMKKPRGRRATWDDSMHEQLLLTVDAIKSKEGIKTDIDAIRLLFRNMNKDRRKRESNETIEFSNGDTLSVNRLQDQLSIARKKSKKSN